MENDLDDEEIFNLINDTLEKNHKSVKFGLSLNDETIYLESLTVLENKRGQGLGTAFMNELCSLCDKYDYYIDLSPSSDDNNNLENDNTYNRLVQFYEKFDFYITSENDGYMSRSPQSQNNLKM
jgi:ribosomal protein S18 acetylase RimI-like enzyme